MKSFLSAASLLALTFIFPQAVLAKTAYSEIRATAPGSSVAGEAYFEELADGVKIRISLKGLTPGKHAFHIHENGTCAEMGKAAGGHFNPEGSPHGDLLKDGFASAHAGDFGNLLAGPDGSVSAELTVAGLSMDEGKFGVVHRSLIVHEKEDDFGQPTGNAGSRVGCGVIFLKD